MLGGANMNVYRERMLTVVLRAARLLLVAILGAVLVTYALVLVAVGVMLAGNVFGFDVVLAGVSALIAAVAIAAVVHQINRRDDPRRIRLPG